MIEIRYELTEDDLKKLAAEIIHQLFKDHSNKDSFLKDFDNFKTPPELMVVSEIAKKIGYTINGVKNIIQNNKILPKIGKWYDVAEIINVLPGYKRSNLK